MTPSTQTLSSDRLRELADRFHGDIIRPGNDAYDGARKVWNGMIDRKPVCIARCKSVADVQAALRFARENGLPVAVRGGGHNAAGLAVCDGGLVIDLGGMRDILAEHRRPPGFAGEAVEV